MIIDLVVVKTLRNSWNEPDKTYAVSGSILIEILDTLERLLERNQ